MTIRPTATRRFWRAIQKQLWMLASCYGPAATTAYSDLGSMTDAGAATPPEAPAEHPVPGGRPRLLALSKPPPVTRPG